MRENITEYIEPSAGSGVFLDYLQGLYLMILNLRMIGIVKQDYLSLDLEYKKG